MIIFYKDCYLKISAWCNIAINKQTFFAEAGPLNEPQIAFICREMLRGLQYLHQHGKMHRDIKVGDFIQ